MGKLEDKVSTAYISSRIRKDLYDISLLVTSKTGLSRRDIVELSFIDFFSQIKDEFKYEDIDLKEHLTYMKLQKLRNMTKLIRNEFLSSHLIIPRMKNDIYKIIVNHRKNKNLSIIIQEYLEIMKKECIHYKNKSEVDRYILDFETDLKNKQIDEIKRKIEDNIKNVVDIKQLTTNIKQDALLRNTNIIEIKSTIHEV